MKIERKRCIDSNLNVLQLDQNKTLKAQSKKAEAQHFGTATFSILERVESNFTPLPFMKNCGTTLERGSN